MRVPISPGGVEAFRTLAAMLRACSERMGAETDKILSSLQGKRDGLGVFAEKIEDNVGQVANIIREQGTVIEQLAQSCEKLAAQIEEVLVTLDLSAGENTSSASPASTQSTSCSTCSKAPEAGELSFKDTAPAHPNGAAETKDKSGLTMRDVAAWGLTAGFLATMGLTPIDDPVAADFRENVEEAYERTLEIMDNLEKMNDNGTLSSLQKEGVSGDPPDGYRSLEKTLADFGAELQSNFKWSSK